MAILCKIVRDFPTVCISEGRTCADSRYILTNIQNHKIKIIWEKTPKTTVADCNARHNLMCYMILGRKGKELGNHRT